MGLNLDQFKKQSGTLTVNITSLMDVLTIILVFLLVNYSAEAEKESPPNYVELPGIVGKTLMLPHEAVVVNIGRDRIAINNEFFFFQGVPSDLDLKQRLEKNTPEEAEFKILLTELYEFNGEPMLQFVEKRFVDILQHRALEKDAPILTIQADKYVPYDLIKEIVKIGAYDGLSKVEFVALREED